MFIASNLNLFILKTKTFSGYFIAFIKSTWNFEHFEEKKHEPDNLSISEIIYSEKRGSLNA